MCNLNILDAKHVWLCVVRIWQICGNAAVVRAPFLRGWKVLTGSLTAEIQPLSKCQASLQENMCVQFPYALAGFKILGLIFFLKEVCPL